jgi:hypothetical protein
MNSKKMEPRPEGKCESRSKLVALKIVVWALWKLLGKLW